MVLELIVAEEQRCVHPALVSRGRNVVWFVMKKYVFGLASFGFLVSFELIRWFALSPLSMSPHYHHQWAHKCANALLAPLPSSH